MNEISLSTDLNQIELEINHHKNIAGRRTGPKAQGKVDEIKVILEIK